ncbi:MAG: flagellar hook-length control protein FliK [Dehalococcoidia bacterium]|nr:flagellar hook-length control protein FliK [Dehalococcoidia bacterium]
MSMSIAPLADIHPPPANEAAVGDSPSTPDGAFAELVEEFLHGNARDLELGIGIDTVTDSLPGEDFESTTGANDLAAMLASLELLLQQQAAPTPDEPVLDTASGAHIAATAVDVPVPDAIVDGLADQPGVIPGSLTGEPEAIVDGPADQPGTVDTEHGDYAAPAAGPLVAEIPVETAEQPSRFEAAAGPAEAVADTESTVARPLETASVPTTAEAQPAADDSVVRSVGNADTTESRHGQDRGWEKQGDRAPNASAQGIAHAAEPSRVAQFATVEVSAAEQPAPPPSDPVELPPAVRQVGDVVLEQVDQAGGEAVIRLDPPELGSVLIRVQLRGDAVHVRVEAEHPSAMNLLRDHTQDLSNLLGDRGLNLADVHVGHGGHGQSQDPNDFPAWARPRRPGDNAFASILGVEGPSAAQAHNRLQSAYNPDGSHIYRI